MKDIVIKKDGFTLVELLATIALLAILVVFVVPEAYSYLKKGTDKALALQVKNVEDASKLYLEDYCVSPINSNYTCTLNKVFIEGFVKYSGRIELQTLVSNDYIDSIVFKNQSCDNDSYIIITENEPKAYLKCGEIKSEGYN